MSTYNIAPASPRDGVTFKKDTALTVPKGAFLTDGPSNNVSLATSAVTPVELVGFSTEAVSATEVKSTVSGLRLRKGDKLRVATTNNSDPLHNLQIMVLSDEKTVNNTGTTALAGVVRQLSVVGEPADKTIVVEVI